MAECSRRDLTSSVPMIEAAPARFSITIIWSIVWLTRLARMRAIESAPRPGAKGTTRRIGRDG